MQTSVVQTVQYGGVLWTKSSKHVWICLANKSSHKKLWKCLANNSHMEHMQVFGKHAIQEMYGGANKSSHKEFMEMCLANKQFTYGIFANNSHKDFMTMFTTNSHKEVTHKWDCTKGQWGSLAVRQIHTAIAWGLPWDYCQIRPHLSCE